MQERKNLKWHGLPLVLKPSILERTFGPASYCRVTFETMFHLDQELVLWAAQQPPVEGINFYCLRDDEAARLMHEGKFKPEQLRFLQNWWRRWHACQHDLDVVSIEMGRLAG